MAAKKTKTEAVPTEKPTTGSGTSTEAAAPEITQEMIAERAYYLSQSGGGGTDERIGTGPRRSCGRARSASLRAPSPRPTH